MKRFSCLFLALILFCFVTIIPLQAATVIDSMKIELIQDIRGDNFPSYGDLIEISAIATYTEPTGIWLVPPSVDCTNLGFGTIVMNGGVTQPTGLYTQQIRLNALRDNVNFLDTSLTVRAISLNGAVQTAAATTTSRIFDITQPEAADARVSSADQGTADTIISNGENILIHIRDLRYQTEPNGGTKAFVDLTPLGGNSQEPLGIIDIGVGVASYALILDATTEDYLDAIEFTGSLNIMLADGLNPVASQTTNTFTIDTIGPTVDEVNNPPTVTAVSGNDPILAGDVLRITARVERYDNETVYVSIPGLITGATPAVNTPTVMTLVNNSGIGSPAIWQIDVNVSDADIRNSAMLASFTFVDDAGNRRIVQREFDIDLETPAFSILEANILYPFGNLSPYQVGTTTCRLEIIASIPVNVPPDNITVNANMTPIGGLAAQTMSQAANGNYRYVVTIDPVAITAANALNDPEALQFAVTAVDTAGNTIVKATTPPVYIDNVPPSIASISITSVQSTVIGGEDFTVRVQADQVENGSVTVDLTALGFDPSFDSRLTWDSANVYSRTFTLPTRAAAYNNKVVEGMKSLLVTVTDSIATNTPVMVGNSVAMYSPQYKFYNGDASFTVDVLYPNNTDSPYDVATTSCKLVLTATVPISATLAPLSVSVDLSSIGGNANQNMPLLGGPNEYTYTYTIPAGTPALEDLALNSFQITVLDKDSSQILQRLATPPVRIDNVMPTLSNVTITSPNPTIVAGDIFTITAQATEIENGSVTVNLTPLGFSSAWSVATLTWQTGSTYSGSFTMPGRSIATGGILVEGNKILRVSANDTIATSNPDIISHLVFDFTPEQKFYNPDNFVIDARVINPNNSVSPYNYATSGCKLEIIASISASAVISPLTATADLSAIGGSSALSMVKISGTNYYIATYTIPDGALEDESISYNFPVTVKDKDGVQIIKQDAPPIRIDNNKPVITSATLTNSDANINVGDVFTITVNVTGAELGSVSVDLSAIDLNGYANPKAVDLPQTTPGSGVFTRTFTLADSITAGIICDADTSFKVTVNDTIGNPYQNDAHFVSAYTNSMLIDNEPPFIVNIATYSEHTVNTSIDDGWVRIQDKLSFHAEVASASRTTGELSTIILNMLPLGQPANTSMVASASNPIGYDYYLPGGVATGTLNRVQTDFLLTVTDNAGNATSTIITIPIDNQPVGLSVINVTTEMKPGIANDGVGTINYNKIVNFHVPYTDSPDFSATGTVDLTAVGSISAAIMDQSNGSYSISVDTATASYELSGHKFRVLIYDEAGNSSLIESNAMKVDCQIPEITSALVTVESGVPTLKTGDQIRITAKVTNNELVLPTVDLTSIGGSAAQPMPSLGGGLYGTIATIGPGTLNYDTTALASFSILVKDNDGNSVSSFTNEIAIDNLPPSAVTPLLLVANLTDVGSTSISLGDQVKFDFEVVQNGATGPAYLDLTAIGGGASVAMTPTGLASYTYTFTCLETNKEYPAYKFGIKVFDGNGNYLTASSSAFNIDCQPIKFSSAGIVIHEDNDDNPLVNVANINDVIKVYASAAAYLDAVSIQATIGSGTVDFATATMTLNGTRHEASFTVASPGTGDWGILASDKLTYKLTAIDDAGNIATMVSGTSAFTVRNEPPVITAGLNFNPDYPTVGVFNLATSTVGDLLFANANFANNATMTKAWLDFSDYGSGTVDMKITGSSAVTFSGISASKFPPVDGDLGKSIRIYAQDEGGNQDSAAFPYTLDNVPPKIVSAEFDGATLTVSLSEDYLLGSIDMSLWKLVGSATSPVGARTTLSFTPANFSDGLMGKFYISLDNAQQIAVAKWASTPVYLEVSNTAAVSAALDFNNNAIRPVAYNPVTITDMSWRERPKVTQVTMTQDWGNGPTFIDIYLNKEIVQSTISASSAVLLYQTMPGEYTSPEYLKGYVFTPADTVSWPDATNDHVRITLNASGTDWIARKIGNSGALKFALRKDKVFARDILEGAVTHISAAAPVAVADNRSGFSFDFDAAVPVLDLASRSLKITASDRMLLFTNDFDRQNATEPRMLMPVPSLNKRVQGFHQKFTIYENDSGSSFKLQLEELQLPADGLYASSTVTLKLTSDDVNQIINLFQNSANPIWKLKIDAAAFTNLWGTGNDAYLPYGDPGPLTMVYPSGYNQVSVAAVSMSDKPPVSAKNANALTFEVELFPPNFDGAPVPIQTNISPTAQLKRQSDDFVICDGTFVNYTSRTVAGTARTVARFTNATALPAGYQRVPAYVEVAGIKDIFDVSYSVTASMAYDLSQKLDSAPDGFNDPASATIEIDTVKPQLVQVIPTDFIGRLPAGNEFRVEFSEAMDPTTIPVLELATTTVGISPLYFTFTSWISSDTAKFSNNSAFVSSTPNGIWSYKVTGGRDEAFNVLADAQTDNVEVRTQAPEVSVGNVTVKTIQSKINSTAILSGAPWTPQYGDQVNFRVLYSTATALHTPHVLEVYDAGNNRYAQAVISAPDASRVATATLAAFNLIDPGMTGPTDYKIRIVDAQMNQTDQVATITYDNLLPDVSSFQLSNIGSETATISYYRANLDLGVNVTTNTSDQIKLAVYQTYPATVPAAATSTHTLTRGVGNNFSTSISRGEFVVGSYSLSIVDMAGNVDPASVRTLIVDKTQPSVISIKPNTMIGNSPANATTFTVEFSEKMDAGIVPVLTLATTTTTISMNFDHWFDADNATTAYYTNADAILTTMNTGTYTYKITGGKDLAGNNLFFSTLPTYQVTVMTKGPFAQISHLTDQSSVYGPTSGIKTNYAFNGNGSATIKIAYPAGPFNTPQRLNIYDASETLIASSAAALNNPSENLIFPDDFNTIPAYVYSDQTYQFKLIDNAANLSGAYLASSLRYDTTVPTVATITVAGPGSYADLGLGGAYYYSSRLGSNTFTVKTSNSEELKLLVIEPMTATSPYTLTSTDGLTHTATLGGSLAPGPYVLAAVDTAGNIGNGAVPMIVDNASPTVTAATPLLSGGHKAGVGEFIITFDEEMNRNVAPTATIATTSATIALTFDTWLSYTQCRFKNTGDMSVYAPGTYSYQITGARDLAGNENTNPAMGSFTIDLYPNAPVVTATLYSLQPMLYNDVRVNKPFSINVAPSVATLTLKYAATPTQTPHELWVYDNGNNLVASISFMPDVANKVASITVDASFFDNLDATPGDEPGNIGPATFKFKLVDQIGNVSATNTTSIVYDALGPVIATATLSTVSDGSNDPLYYNEALHGALSVKFGSTATDSLSLVVANGIATRTYAMTLNDPADQYSATLSTSQAAALATGTYVITAADAAGNFATGAASTTVLIIDRDAPMVDNILSWNGANLTTIPAGGATFTVTFNESMKASATPVLAIATGSTTISCTFTGWLDAPAYTQAQFKTATAITAAMPQGAYDYKVTATDLTGNKITNANSGTIAVLSRGPIIAAIYSQSMQATTASGTEVLRDTPFSFNVAPGAATLTVKLSAAADEPVALHFMQSNTTVASFPLTINSMAATFTWSAATIPTPTTYPSTYQIKLVDAAGDFSLESYNWTVDASAPTVLEAPTVSRGILATDSVYFNPARHGYLSIAFKAIEPSAPKMRIRGTNSTDTYALTTAGTNLWSGSFNGRYSRGTDPKPLMPDGIYALDLVDVAGNVASPAINYDIVIDSVSPVVSTYSTFINGNPVTAFAPSAGNLEVRVVTAEALNETGIFWVDVFNSSNLLVKHLPLINSGAYYSAFWDGKTSAGTVAGDGYYYFRASDYAGNLATAQLKVLTLTSEFKVTSAVQISSSSAKLIFNHEVDGNLAGAAILATGSTITGIEKLEANSVKFNIDPIFTHQTSYKFDVSPATIRSIYGAPVTAPNNSITMIADGQGPKISSVDFTGITSQNQFKIIFDEEFKPETVSGAAYTLTGPAGTPTISSAIAQSGNKTILLTTSANLVENADYQINASGLTDKYGNLSPTPNLKEFKGRDLTPPVLEVSAFSNPANENDIIVVVVSNEDLKAPPKLQITQTNAPAVTTTMQAGTNNRSFMIGVHLSSSYSGTVYLLASAQDLAGNQGSGNTTFTAVRVSVNQAASIKSADEKLLAEFSKTSLKEDALLKIIAHRLENTRTGNSSVRMQQQARLALGLRASQAQDTSLSQPELIPMGVAYEVAIAADKINDSFNVFLDLPEATATTGLGLFYQNGESWKFLSANMTSNKKFAAKSASSQMFAILRDVKGPEVTLAADIDLNEPFRTSRPEFRGQITDAGSGLDLTSVTAHIDAGAAQNVSLDSNGNFVFRPMADLTGGWHDLTIKARDKTGNDSAMAAVRFEVVVPLQITQIAQYPNPARVRTFIRISANRGDVSEDLVKVKIYDVAGHKVVTLDGIRPVNEKWGINARYVYDIPWDLRNSAGKTVANGVYFAKIEVRDPDNPAKKVKETFKIAILR